MMSGYCPSPDIEDLTHIFGARFLALFLLVESALNVQLAKRAFHRIIKERRN